MTVLVTAGSRHGATAEIAEEIARVLNDRGVSCRVAPLDEAEPTAFDAVVLGSAVYAGRWLEPARTFVADNLATLRARPVWLFSSGPVGRRPKPAGERAVDLDAIVRDTKAREHRILTGKLDRAGLGPLERTVVRAVRAEEGDFRDWDAVRAYANEIADALTG